MNTSAHRAVARATATMRERYSEPITVDDLARVAMFSKFYFSRMFHETTGLTPGRFLTAIRLAEAKRLLLSTSASVTTISYRIGYNSVGTFSARFSSSVGLSPVMYRKLCGASPLLPASPGRNSTANGTIRGHLDAAPAVPHGQVFVGLFPTRIAERPPVAHTIAELPGTYDLQPVRAGTWHLLACVLPTPGEPASTCPYTSYGGTVTVSSGTVTTADLTLGPASDIDPPVLLALPVPALAKPALAAV